MKKKKRRIRIGRLITILLLIFMVSIGIMAVIRSDFFSLKKVEVLDNDILSKSEIINLSNIKLEKNIFDYNKKDIKNNIIKNPYIEDVSVTRKIPSTIVIHIKEKEILAALNQDENYYYIDNKGNLIGNIDKSKIKDNTLIISTNFNIKNNKIKYNSNTDKEYLVSLAKNIKNQNLQVEIKDVDFTRKSEIVMKNKKGLDIYILKDKDISKNINKLSKILLDLNTKGINYGTLSMEYKNYVLYSVNKK